MKKNQKKSVKPLTISKETLIRISLPSGGGEMPTFPPRERDTSDYIGCY